MELIVKVNKLNDIYTLDNADSYLLSNRHFSYRYDESFCINKIRTVKNHCKKNNKKVYVLLNKIFKDHELEKLKDFIIKLQKVDIDGIFFTDFAVFMLAKEINFEHKCIFYHETFLRNSYDILTYKSYGINKIVCSKDMNLEDIKHLPSKLKDDFGVLCFGYIPLYESQRKIITHYAKHNNLDKSIINSKELSLKENTREEQYKVIEQNGTSSIFDSKVLSYINYVNELSNNVNMFIIDSLFFDVNYIKEVINAFKDSITNNTNNEETIKKLDETIEFTTGFLNKRIGLM